MNAPAVLLTSLRQAVAFEPVGERIGNLTLGRGRLDGRELRVALVENHLASGAIGPLEAQRLGAMLAADASPVVLYLDSAGAKVSEGLRALGAFRALYRTGLDALLRGTPIAAVLGRNCYGGSSMLAHLATRRLFNPATQLAMSGPAIIAAAAGMNPLDDMFRAIAKAALGAAARAKASAGNSVWAPGLDLAAWLREALAAPGDVAGALERRHEDLAGRFERGVPPLQWEAVRRRDLEKIYDGGYEARESHGLIEGKGMRAGVGENFIGLLGSAPLSAGRAWHFADLAWKLAGHASRLEVYLDCATHAARLEDEKLVLSEYIVDMGFALARLAHSGAHVGLTVAGKAGGGVYVALAAPAAQVTSLYGAEIQVLPGAAVAAILGESRETTPSFEEYRAGGVADREIKLGLVPGSS